MVEELVARGREYRWIQTLLIISLLLVGFALRTYRLDGQSLWSDEGISLLRSERSLPELLDTMPVEQMPGYFVLLHGWLRLAGTEDFALRYLSLWPSLLVVALAYRLAATMGSHRIGLIAAALLATNAFQIWYAQEARTYSWLLAIGLLSTLLFWRLLTTEQRRGGGYWGTLIVYGISTAAVVYLHYYGALVPLAHLFFIGCWTLYRRAWQFLRHWMGAGLLGLLLFLPWAPRVLSIFDFPGWREPIDPWQIPWQILTLYTVGGSLPAAWQPWLPWLYLALIGLGLMGWWRVDGRALFFMLSCTFVPLGLTFAIALQTLDYHERYTIVATAPLLLLAAAGIAVLPLPNQRIGRGRQIVYWFGQLASIALLGLLLAGNGSALKPYYVDDRYHKPDFRAAVDVIERFGEDGDVVILDGPDPNLVFLHYYHAPYPIYDMRPFINTPREESYAAMVDQTTDAQRVWEVLLFHEPRGVQEWLARNGWSTPPQDHNGIRLTLYGLTADALQEETVDLPVGDTLLLTTTATPRLPLTAGDLLAVSTYWTVLQPPPDYKFSLRLVNSQGEIVLSQDYVPQNWFSPTSTWPVGASMVDQRGFLLSADFPAGTYQLTLRLYDPTNGAVAETPMGQDIDLGPVEIVP